MSQWKKRTKDIEIPGRSKLNRLKCDVCGYEFVPSRKERYSVKENRIQGGLASAIQGSSEEPKVYDCFDCPACGCQMVAKERLRKVKEDLEVGTCE